MCPCADFINDAARGAPPRKQVVMRDIAWAVAICSIFTATPAIGAPRSGVRAAYNVSTFGGTATRMEDGGFSIMHGDGGTGIFVIQLERSTGVALVRSFGTASVEFDEHELSATDVLSLEQEYGDSKEGRAEAEYQRILRALRFHRPPVEFDIEAAGVARTTPQGRHRRFDRCAHAFLSASIDQAISSLSDDDERRDWRRRRSRISNELQPQLRDARIMTRLFSVTMTPAPNGYWTQLARRNQGEPPRARPNQHDWRFEQTMAYGEEFLAEGEVGARPRSAFDGVCRELRPRGLPNTIRDTCSITAVYDRRDGWPIAVTLNRIQETRDRSTSNSGMIFWRVRALEGLVPPPNLCPTN